MIASRHQATHWWVVVYTLHCGVYARCVQLITHNASKFGELLAIHMVYFGVLVSFK